MSLTPGTRLGPYEILGAIGAGGMGEVYRASDRRLDRDVAIKILPDLFARDPERLARFEREAKTLASLNHPGIAQIYGLEESGGLRALVMELVEGTDLSVIIARGPIPLAETLPLAKQIADALEAAHELGIVHRDVKPANVKVRNDGTVKVLDFGLAKALALDGANSTAEVMNSPTLTGHATQLGVILGTAAYMSPEQARGKVVDKRADIWAFGCVVYETLTGKRAFAGETLTDVLATVVKSDPDWQALPPDTPRSVRALLRRCLQKDPIRRLHDIADARIEIQDAIAEPEVPSQTPAEGRRAARWPSVVPWSAAALLAVALLVTQVEPFRPASPILPVAHLEMNLPPGVEPYTNVEAVALSPNGARVAFIGVEAGHRQVYVRDLDKFAAVPVPRTDNPTSVFFSPNGRAIGVIQANRVLERVSLDDFLAVPLARGAEVANGGAWGPDDRITFGRNDVFWQVSASGGTPTQLTTLDAGKGEKRHAFPTVVAGGKALLFTVATGSSPDAVHIEALSLVTHLSTEVGAQGTGPLFLAGGRLIFSRDGAVLAAPFDEDRLKVTGPAAKVIDHLRLSSTGQPVVAVSGSGSVAYMSGTSVSQLVWVSRQGVEQPITDTDRMYVFPRLESPAGRRILVSASGNLWIKDTVGKAFTMQNTQTTAGNSYPVWTLDGKHVVYRAVDGLYVMDVDGGRPRLLLGTTYSDFPSSVSLNGDTLIFLRLTEDRSGDVYALSLRGEPKPHKLVSTSNYEGGAQLSPDDHWLVYASNASETEPSQLWVSPFPGLEARWPVSQRGMFPRWTKGGAELVYRDSNKMMAVDVVIKNGVPTFTSPQPVFDDRYLFGPSTSIANYDVSPNGQQFVMVKGEPGSSRLNIVLNWFEELKRLVPVTK